MKHTIESGTVISGDARKMNLAQFEQYQIIVADPPWYYAQRLNGKTAFGRGTNYAMMHTDEICAMPVKDLSADRCHLYLWTTCPLLPDAVQVMKSWGFLWVTVAFVWVKMNKGIWTQAQEQTLQRSIWNISDDQVEAFLNNLTWFGPGYYTGSNVELVFLARRGKPFKHAKGCKASQLVFATHGKQHSEKPESIQDRIEWMYPHATPRLELFGRRARKGWTVFGNEVELRYNTCT